MTYLTLFTINLIGVACKSFQQISVVEYKWLLIPPVSYAMQIWLVANVYFVTQTESLGLVVLVGGTGAFLGSWLGMYLQQLIDAKKNTALITQDEIDQHQGKRGDLLKSKGIPITWDGRFDDNYAIGIEMIENKKSPGIVAYEYTWALKNGQEENTQKAS